MAKTVQQIVQTLKRGTGSGKVFTPEQVKPYLDKELQQAADALKEFMIATIELGGKHKLRRDGLKGLYQSSSVTFTTDGAQLTLPDYAEALDAGRKPGVSLVPLAALVAWIKRYRIVGRVKSTGKYKKASAESVNAAAAAIQRAIYVNGIAARPFITATLDFASILISQIIDEIIVPEIISTMDFFLTAK